jgi:hypothetical protein
LLQSFVTNSTWGTLGTMTWGAIANYVSHENHGELYAVLNDDSLIRASQKAPNGFDIEQLTYDMRLFRSEGKTDHEVSYSARVFIRGYFRRACLGCLCRVPRCHGAGMPAAHRV